MLKKVHLIAFEVIIVVKLAIIIIDENLLKVIAIFETMSVTTFLLSKEVLNPIEYELRDERLTSLNEQHLKSPSMI